MAGDAGDELPGAGVCGITEDAGGWPCSTISPWSMNTTRSAAARANCSSWLTTTIVIPDSRMARMTASTLPTSSGSRAEVGSSKSMIFGSSARARAIATRCCCPPDSSLGCASALSARPTRVSAARARSAASVRDSFNTLRSARATLPSAVMCG